MRIASLSQARAPQGKRTAQLLYRVNCDERSLEDIFGSAERPGLLDQLSGRADSVLLTSFESLAARPEVADELRRLLERRVYRSRFHGEDRPCTARLFAVCDALPDALRGSEGVSHVAVSPLRQRAADLPLMARTVLRRVARRRGMAKVSLGEDAVHRIKAYGWPDNLREV